MKKIYVLAIGFVFASVLKSNAQDTLIYESFNFQDFYDNMVDDVNPPPGTDPNDPLWYSYDADNLSDGSGSSRPGGWFAIQPFSDVDTLDNVALGSNSWFAAPAYSDNWLVSPAITLDANDTLFWKSAPRQTPRYLDGYQVKISTTTNDDLAFTTTLFTAAEMTSLGSDTTFSTFGFSSGFVHGQDGTYIDYAGAVSNPAHIGQLRPFFVPLSAYAGQTVFIAFRHRSFDDNLISIDDFMVRGNNTPAGIVNESKGDIKLNVFPNPSVDNAQINYTLTEESNVTISIYDVTGKLIASDNKGSQVAGRHFSLVNTEAMSNGFYTVSVKTNSGITTTKMIVK
jgi:hypothetical protein